MPLLQNSRAHLGKLSPPASLVAALEAVESGTRQAGARRSFIAPLVLRETPEAVFFESGKMPGGARHFLNYFRWVFLGGSFGLAWLALGQLDSDGDTPWFAKILLWFFAAVSVAGGFLGAFVIFPMLQRFLGRAEKMDFSPVLPVFDLRARSLLLPDGAGEIPFSALGEFVLGTSEGGWFPLEISDTAGKTHFLVNYPVSAKSRARKHAALLTEKMRAGLNE